MARRDNNDDPGLGLPTKQQSRSMEEIRAALQPWLAARVEGAENLEVTDVNVPSGSGLANETVLLDAKWTEGGETRECGYVIRIETPDPLFPGTTAERQFLMNQTLADEPDVPVPHVLGLENDTSVLGAPFYLMERIEGRVPQDNPPYNHSGWFTEISTEERALMWEETVRVMANLHKVDPGKFQFLNPTGETDGLWQHLHYYIDEFDTPVNESHRVIDAGRRWLLDNYPGKQGLHLAWGDARPGNMIYKDGKCMAVLDWDMVNLAPPETDLAWICSFDISFTHSIGVERQSGFRTPAELIDRWEHYYGRKVENFEWYLALNHYKNAVIVRRLAKMLKKNNLLPEGSEYMENNNIGVQYLASYLDIPSDYPIESPWPGLNV